jgi:signal transduction histidine kinase
MASDSLLRRRLALMLVVTAAAASTLLPFTFWLTDSLLQPAAMQDLLGFEALGLSRRDVALLEVDTGRSQLRYYRPRLDPRLPLPPELAPLAPGSYRNIVIGDRHYAVTVRELGGGDRSYLAYDTGFVTAMESGLWLFVMALAVMIGLVAWVFAQRMVDRALAPFTQMLRDVLQLEAGRGGQRITATSRDRELRVILLALNRYLAQIDTLVERERTFAAAASHELRTPLTVIQGAASAIAEVPQVPERVQRRLARAVQEMRHDLDALLALSAAQDAPQPQELQLDAWLPQQAEAHAAAAGAAKLEWKIASPVRVSVPVGVLNIIFANLLRNALRAAGGGTVTVEVHVDAIAVCDDGPGIPADELPHVFKPRFRGHDGGSGMGLYIAKTLAQRYGWRLTLVNQPGGGLCATLQFGGARAGRGAEAATNSSSAPLP